MSGKAAAGRIASLLRRTEGEEKVSRALEFISMSSLTSNFCLFLVILIFLGHNHDGFIMGVLSGGLVLEVLARKTKQNAMLHGRVGTRGKSVKGRQAGGCKQLSSQCSSVGVFVLLCRKTFFSFFPSFMPLVSLSEFLFFITF